MSDDVISGLLAGKSVERNGAFTVDADKARSKMERFRLANPLLYTVELVQAAALAGAEQVDITVDADDFALSFRPRMPIGRAELDDLESAILVRSKTTHPARLQLALAVSAAQALEPARIRIEANGVVLTVTKDGAKVEDGPTRDVVTFTLKEQFKVGHFVEFFQGLAGRTEEEKLLRDRCRYAGLKVFVNGKEVSGRPWPGELHVDLIGKGVRGAVGYLNDVTDASTVMLLRAGVIQEELPLADVYRAPPGMFAVVDADDLERDASFSRFVRDGAFKNRMNNLSRAIDECAALLERGVADENADALARARAHALWAGKRLFEKSQSRAITLGRSVVLGAPLFVDPLGKRLSLQRIKQETGESRAVRCRAVEDQTAIDAEVLQDDFVVQLRGERDKQLLEAVGVTIADVAPDLKKRAERLVARQRFRARPRGRMPRGVLRQVDVTAGNFSVEIGLRDGGQRNLEISVNVDDCLLMQLNVPFSIPGLTFIMNGKFTPTSDYENVVRDPIFAQAVRQAVAALPELFNEPFQMSVARSLRVKQAQLALLEKSSSSGVLWREAKALLCKSASDDTEQFPAFPLTGSKAHAVTRVDIIPLFPTKETSIIALGSSSKSIGFVAPDTPPFKASMSLVVAVGQELLSALRTALPEHTFVNLENEAKHAARMRRFFERAPLGRIPDGFVELVVVQEKVNSNLRRRVFGLMMRAKERDTQVRVLLQGRLVQDQTVSGALIGLAAVVDEPDLTLDDNLRVTDFTAYREAADQHVPDIMQRLIERSDHPELRWWFARQLVACAFPVAQAHEVYSVLARRKGKSASVDGAPAGAGAKGAWLEILHHVERLETSGQLAVFRAVIDRGLDISAKTLQELAPAKRAATGQTNLLAMHARGHDDVLDAVLNGFRLGELVYMRLDRTTKTLAEIVKDGGKVRTTTLDGNAPEGFSDVYVVTPDAAAVLAGVGLRVDVVDDDIVAARARIVFERQDKVRASLPASLDVLAKIDVDEDGLHGQVAILKGAPATQPPATLELLHLGRRLLTMDIGSVVKVRAAATLDARDISPNKDFTGVVADRKREALENRVRAFVFGLVDDVLKTAPSDADVRARALEIALQASSKAKGSEARLIERVMAAPLYTTVEGKPRPLSGVTSSQPLRTLPSAPQTKTPRGFEDVVVVTTANERFVLERVCRHVHDVQTSWTSALDVEKRKARLLPLPTSIDGALHVRQAGLRDTSLTIALTADARSVAMVGGEGLHVATEVLPEQLLPFHIIIDGQSFVSGDWASVRLDQRQLQAIVREATKTWAEALSRVKKQPKLLAGALGDVMRDVAMRIAAKPITDMPHDAVGVRSQLKRATLFAIESGGLVSLETLIETRDPWYERKLVSLGLLAREAPPPPSPPPPPPPRAPEPPPVEAAPEPPPETKKVSEEKAPEREKAPEPVKEPERVPSPSEILHARVRQEIAVLRKLSKVSLSETELARLRCESRKKKALVEVDRAGAVLLNVDDKLAQAALVDARALLLTTLAVTSGLNTALESLTDDEERAMLVAAAKHAASLS